MKQRVTSDALTCQRKIGYWKSDKEGADVPQSRSGIKALGLLSDDEWRDLAKLGSSGGDRKSKGETAGMSP